MLLCSTDPITQLPGLSCTANTVVLSPYVVPPVAAAQMVCCTNPVSHGLGCEDAVQFPGTFLRWNPYRKVCVAQCKFIAWSPYLPAPNLPVQPTSAGTVNDPNRYVLSSCSYV